MKKIATPARVLLAATLTASLALSPLTAAPARADSNGGAIAAAGLIALLMAGIAASNSQAQTAPRDRWSETDNDWRRIPTPQPPRERHESRKELPNECRVTARRGPSSEAYYDKSCLMQELRGARFLPDRCEEDLRVRGAHGRQEVYAESCLARYGYFPERQARRW